VRVVELLVWWVALSLVWLGTLSTGSALEIAVGVGGAGLGALAAVLARSALDTSWRPKARWLQWALKLPWSVLTDAVRVLFGRSRATTREVRVSDVAVAATLLNVTPGTVVVAARKNVLVLHALGEKPSGLERELTR
jgi:multisubunit Na+/H+ antiporter MnhE subunit